MKIAQKDHSLLTEVAYVQNQNQEELSRFLRALISNVGDEDNAAWAKVNAALSSASSVNKTHKNILINALRTTAGVFGVHPESYMRQPLWTMLLKKNLGLRLVSSDFKNRSDQLFRAFSLPFCDDLTTNINDPFLAYRLANFNRAAFLATLAQGNINTELTLRIKIRLAPELSLKNEIVESGLSEITKNSLLASLIVNSIKSKAPMDDSIEKIIQNLDAFLAAAPKQFTDVHQLLTEIHILNSLCFYDLAQKNFPPVHARLLHLEKQFIPRLKKLSISSMNHVVGNMYFHKSLLSESADTKLEFLQKAVKFDRHFYDGYYRMAQIYHDRGSDLAQPYYEAALSYSPLPWEVLNDYGVLLNDLGDRSSLESLEALTLVLETSGKKS